MMKNIKNILIAGLVCCGISATTTSCRENEFGEVDLDIPEDTYTPIEASYSPTSSVSSSRSTTVRHHR